MLHVIEEPSRSERGMEVARSMAQLEFLARKEFEFARVSRRVERGRAADCILDYARSHAVDAIVMTAGGSETLSRCALGHVTEEVLMGTPCAVWMEWTADSKESVRQVCCAVGLDGADEAVLSRAAEVAGDLGAELTIIHAVTPEPPMILWWDADGFEQEIRIARLRVNELRERYAPAARLHVEAGRVDWVVSQALYRLNAGLLVAAGQGDAIAAAALVCPVLRVPRPLPQVVRVSQPHRAGTLAIAATA